MNPTRSPASRARTDTRKSDRSVFTKKTSGYPLERCLRPGARGTREQFLQKFTIGPIGAPVHGRTRIKIGPGCDQSHLGLTQTPEVCPRDKTPSGPFPVPDHSENAEGSRDPGFFCRSAAGEAHSSEKSPRGKKNSDVFGRVLSG